MKQLVSCLLRKMLFLAPALIHAGGLSAQVVWQGDDFAHPLSWNIASNWNGNAVPTSSSNVVVGAPAPAVVDMGPANALTLDVQADGQIEIQGGRSLNISGTTLTNNGLITVNSDHSTELATLNLGSNGLTLDGNGEIVLAASKNDAHLTNSFSPTTQLADHTIRGEGQVAASIVNYGTITASEADGDSTAELLLISGSKTNHGLIQSSPTATLNVAVNLTQGPTGRLVADTSTVFLNNITVAGGKVESANGGIFRTSGNGLAFDAVDQLNGQLNLVSASGISGNLLVRGGGFENNGTIVVNQDNVNSSFLDFAETGTISGTGEIVLNSPAFGARVVSATGAVGSFGAGQTVRGVGQIEGEIINNGLIIAEPRSGGDEIEFTFSPTKTNNSVIRADANATLAVRATTIVQDSVAGQILANGGIVEFRGNAVIKGGRIEAAGAGQALVTGATRFENVTNNAPLQVQTGPLSLTLGGASFINNATLNVASNLRVDGNVVIGGSGEIVLDAPSAGIFEVLSGATATLDSGQVLRRTAAGTSRVNGPGTFINNGRIEGASASVLLDLNGPVEGAGVMKDVNVRSVHSPGGSGATAQVLLEGVYQLNNFGAHLDLEIGGTTAGDEYDQLFSLDPGNVINVGSSNTQLNVSLINGFLPAQGDIFTLITTAGLISANFQTVNLPNLPTGWAWRNVSTAQSIAYQAIAPLAADFDEDGDVDGNDLTAWHDGFGISSGAAHTDGDADDDSSVTGGDFLIWQRQLGTATNVTTAVNVPEPPMNILTALALAFICWHSAVAGNYRRWSA